MSRKSMVLILMALLIISLALVACGGEGWRWNSSGSHRSAGCNDRASRRSCRRKGTVRHGVHRLSWTGWCRRRGSG